MLLWRPSGRNKYIFLFELVIISTIAHLMVGVLLFVVYKGGVSQYRIELGRNYSPTLFMPLKHAHMFNGAESRQERSSYTRNGASATGTTGYEHAQGRHFGSDTTMQLESESKKTTLARHESASVTVAKQKELKSKKTAKNRKKKNLLMAKRAKKMAQEKVQHELVPEIKEQKQALPKESEKEVPSPKQVTQDKPVQESIAKVEAPVVPEHNNQESSGVRPIDQAQLQEGLEQGSELMTDLAQQEFVIGPGGYVGDSMTAEQARMHECIEQEIGSRWKMPRGLSKDLVCQIKCSVGGNGRVDSCVIEKSSGVLMYDMSARMAARAMELPQWAWAKEFIIVFNNR